MIMKNMEKNTIHWRTYSQNNRMKYLTYASSQHWHMDVRHGHWMKKL